MNFLLGHFKLVFIFAALKNLKERRLRTMLIIPVKEGENIDRALKRYKRKFVKTTVKNQLQERKQFTKPSIARRTQIQKAQYVQGLRDQEVV